MPKYISIFNDAGNEVQVPARYEVCPECNGEGKSSAYLGAYTSEQLYQMDDEWISDYIGGAFDRVCENCAGNRVVSVIDRDRATDIEMVIYDKYERERYEDERLFQMENAASAYAEGY